MITKDVSIILMVAAFIVTTVVYPHVLNFARKHHIVDNPNARKLQRVPVPVMGGTAVFIGMFVAVIVGYFLLKDFRLIKALALLLVMYLIGVWDDRKDVSASFRFLVEILVVWFMILLLGVEINNFHSLWGIRDLPEVISVPLSLIAGVGIMNAINLIDGVDGYCSSYGVMACVNFAFVFYYAGDITMFTLALIAIGALVPFFFHNVFGRSSKMFLGDGGSLMLGTLLTMFTFRTLSSNSPCAAYGDTGLSLVALTLAILAVPVFDTLRVMILRVARGRSPFHPDKTHLHHVFIEMNYSHLMTSALIVSGNLFCILVLLLCWYLGVSINAQFYIVIGMAFLFTWGFYFFVENEHRKNDGDGSEAYQRWCKRGKATNFSATPIWRLIRNIVDSGLLGGRSAKEIEMAENEKKEKKRVDPRV